MKRKGFTLVELLGVIVVLAVIALIAVPSILGVIDKSRKSSLKASGYGLVEAGTLYYAQHENSKTVRFDIKNNEITNKEENKLTYKGSVKEGTVLINHKGQVTVCINDGKYAAYKNFQDNQVTIVDNKTCTIPENSNIVYLDNEATIDINLEELVTKMNQMEQKIKEQSQKIEALENNKVSELEITNQITNLNNTHHVDMATINNKIGITDISSIGSGTITSAISSLNNTVSKNNIGLSTTAVTKPWLAIKENWSSIPVGLSSGYIGSAQTFGYIFYKLSDSYGSGLVFGYSSGWVWHVYRYGDFYYENVPISGNNQY